MTSNQKASKSTFGPDVKFWMLAADRIDSVGRILDYLDEFLSHVEAQALLRRQREFEAAEEGPDLDLAETELELTKDEWVARMPAHFYGSLLVLLWSEVEAIIEEFAKEIQTAKGVSLALSDIRGGSAYTRLRKYVQAVLGLAIEDDRLMEDLYFLRNLFAHQGGKVRPISEKGLQKVKAIEASYPGVSTQSGGFWDEPFVVVTRPFLEVALHRASALIERLTEVHPGKAL